MSNKVGDNLRACIKRGSLLGIDITITRATGGAVVVSLMPASGGVWKDDMIYKKGLDGKIDVQWYEFIIKFEYLQTDKATLADLFASALDSQFHITGVTTTLTLHNSETLTLNNVRFTRIPHAEGFNSVMAVSMDGFLMHLTPVFR